MLHSMATQTASFIIIVIKVSWMCTNILDNACVKDGGFRLLDGDKISALFALFLKTQIDTLNWDGKVSLGVVQTAYANGSSTEFLKNKLVSAIYTKIQYNLHASAQYRAYDMRKYGIARWRCYPKFGISAFVESRRFFCLHRGQAPSCHGTQV